VAKFQDKVPNPTLWSLRQPNLHNMTVALPGVDAITVRFG
jgi:beta-galactosidase/beta-glucuronidase